MFQSSFELTGYITSDTECPEVDTIVSKLFRAYRLYNVAIDVRCEKANVFQSSFELTGYITATLLAVSPREYGFKALSSLQVI